MQSLIVVTVRHLANMITITSAVKLEKTKTTLFAFVNVVWCDLNAGASTD